MSFTNYLEERILNHFFRNIAQTPSASVFVGLLSVSTSEEVPTVTELPATDGYARQTAVFGAPSQGADFAAIANTGIITFGPNSSGASNWPTAVAFGIFDAATGGNALAIENLDAPRTVEPGDSAEFAVGTLVVRQS